MTFLKNLVQARWFPTVTKPILVGAVASGITFGLHVLGVTSFIPSEVNDAATAAVGFIVTAIAQPSKTSATVGTVQVQTTAAVHQVSYKPGTTLGETVAQSFLTPLAQEIDADPSLLNSVAQKALERVLNPIQVAPASTETAASTQAPTPVPASVAHLPQT